VVDVSKWQASPFAGDDVIVAIDIASRHMVSVRDVCVIVAAVKAGARILWSEDLADGVDYGGVTVRNPFR
jgi:predicted nucleic acid-binding protein